MVTKVTAMRTRESSATVSLNLVDQHPEPEREEDLLAYAVQQVQPVVVAVVLSPDHALSPRSHLAQLAFVQVGEAEDSQGSEERGDAATAKAIS